MLRWLALCATLATAQLPPGIQMGAPGGDDEVLTHNAEELTDETFEERRMEHELFVVLFRDKTEQQAKQMEKEFELAASDLVERSFSSAVALGMVDLTEAKGAAKKAGVTEGPVIEVWRRGKKLPLGPSSGDARSIVNFVSYLTAPVSKKLESSADVNAWLRDKETTVVLGIFADASRPSHNVWMKMAETMRPPYMFAEASVADAQGAKLFGGVELDGSKNQFAVVPPHRWVGKEEAAFHLAADFRTMPAFVEAHAMTKVYPITGASRKAWIRQNRALVSVCLDLEKMGKLFKYIVNRLHKLLVAEPEIDARFAFTIMDTKESRHVSKEFGIDASRDFAVTVVNFSTLQYFGTEALSNVSSADSFSPTQLVPWLRSIAAGEQPPFVKSEPPPEVAAAAGEVHTAVGTTFAHVVDDESVDVLLAVYAQGKDGEVQGRHALAGVAKLFEPLPTVRVAMINMSANAVNFSRYRYGWLPRGEETRAFFVGAGAKGAPTPLDPKGQEKELEPLKLAEFMVERVAKSKAPSSAGHAEALGKVSTLVKQMRKAKTKEAAERRKQMFGDALGEEEGARRKKKKRKRKAKEEL